MGVHWLWVCRKRKRQLQWGRGGPAVAERRRAEMSIVVVNIVNGVRFRDVDEYWRGTGDGRDENR